MLSPLSLQETKAQNENATGWGQCPSLDPGPLAPSPALVPNEPSGVRSLSGRLWGKGRGGPSRQVFPVGMNTAVRGSQRQGPQQGLHPPSPQHRPLSRGRPKPAPPRGVTIWLQKNPLSIGGGGKSVLKGIGLFFGKDSPDECTA